MRDFYANQIGYSDRYPFEIIRRVSDKTIEIRAMGSKLAADWKPDMIPGGFCAHTVNNGSQRWEYWSDHSANKVRIRRHKDGRWYDKHGNRYALSDQPYRFHDYNF